MYKHQDQELYKTTTIRIRKTDYDVLKDIAAKDNRSTNYLVNKILIDYIIFKDREKNFNIFE